MAVRQIAEAWRGGDVNTTALGLQIFSLARALNGLQVVRGDLR